MTDWMPWPIFAFLLGSLAVAAIVLVFEKRREQRRIEDLTTWAATHGFTIEAGLRRVADAGFSPELAGLPLFRRGRSHRVRNLVRGPSPDGGLLLFDYRYTVQSGKNSSSLEQTVVAYEVTGAALPSFELRPEGLFSRIGQALGDPDIDFDSSEAFSRQYQLRGHDVDAIRRLFERQAVPFLANSEGWSIEGSGSWLIVFRHNRRQKVEEMSPFLESTRMVMQTLARR